MQQPRNVLYHRVIVIGASAGGVEAVSRLVSLLPASFTPPVFIVINIGSKRNRLAEVLGRVSKLPVTEARDGEVIAAGHIYIAPPDRHVLLGRGAIRLSASPQESFSRPAVDPLFRSAAYAFGRRVVGIVLTGHFDDGTAGLRTIKELGGIAIVQDHNEALAPHMPLNARATITPDHICTIAEIGALLVRYD